MADGSKPKQKRESRMRCQVCGGPLKVDDDYAKTDNIMVRKRRCVRCGRRHEGVEIIKPLDSGEKQKKLFE